MEDYLYTPCPVAGCKNSTKEVHVYWKHYNCGGRTKIRYEDITIVCEECPSSRDIMFAWLFNCGQHDFQKGSLQGWIFALSIMGQQKGNQNEILRACKQIVQKF